jgi:hypothetical protein
MRLGICRSRARPGQFYNRGDDVDLARPVEISTGYGIAIANVNARVKLQSDVICPGPRHSPVAQIAAGAAV